MDTFQNIKTVMCLAKTFRNNKPKSSDMSILCLPDTMNCHKLKGARNGILFVLKIMYLCSENNVLETVIYSQLCNTLLLNS